MIKELDNTNLADVNIINNFLKENSADYMQNIKWNIVRNESKKYFLFSVEGDNILWSCNLLEKEDSSGKYLYAPRGPVFKNSQFNLINDFLVGIRNWMRLHNYFKLIINPYLDYSKLSLISKNFDFQVTNRDDYGNLKDSCKLAIIDIIFDENALLNMLPSKFRQNTRRSYRKNLTFKMSKHIDLNNFYNLYLQTAERHDFKPHDMSYFEKIQKIYENDLIFLEVWHDAQPLAMSIDIVNNNKLIYLYGVSSSENRNLLGMYYLQWEAIKYCINNNLQQYDFGGVFCEENDFNNKDYGLYKFKQGYCYKGFIDIVPDLTFTFGEKDND